MNKSCGCDGACTDRCRLERWAIRKARDLRQKVAVTAQAPVNGTGERRLKPSALAVLGRLQLGPATNRELMDAAGFRYSARIKELRWAGHRISVTAPGPTPGVRLYTLVEGGV